MKKNYSAPGIEKVQILGEGMIAGSNLPIGTEPGTGMGTQGRGWNSADWSEVEDDIEE